MAAILDGAPSLLHEALKDRLKFDDPDNLAAEYQPGEKRHGTAMASLVVHGELVNGQDNSLTRKVYHRVVMQPDPHDRLRSEHIPDAVFFEDRIERAVRAHARRGRCYFFASIWRQDYQPFNRRPGTPVYPYTKPYGEAA